MSGIDGCIEPFFCWSHLPGFAVAWDGLQLPAYLCKPYSQLVAAACRRHIFPSLLPQQCPKPALTIAPWLRYSAGSSPVQPVVCFYPRMDMAGGTEPFMCMPTPLALIPGCTWSSASHSPEENRWTLSFRSATLSSSLAMEDLSATTSCFSSANFFSLGQKRKEVILNRASLKHTTPLLLSIPDRPSCCRQMEVTLHAISGELAPTSVRAEGSCDFSGVTVTMLVWGREK